MESRKLRTILFADITGYTTLMQNDEPKALKILNIFNTTVEQSTKNFSGDLIQYYGDACLLSFESAVNAVNCAMAMQKTFLQDDVPVRIGLHLGDVVFRNNNVFGDGVNIASRIESMSIPGSILFSDAVRRQIKNHPEIAVKNLGYYEFKNVDEPMEVFAIANNEFNIPNPKHITGKLKEPKKNVFSLKLIIPIVLVILVGSIGIWYFSKDNDGIISEIPSLAVLDFPYEGDSTYAYLANGFLRETNALLTGFKKLAVTARTSSSLFESKADNVQNVGQELDVDYVLLGKIKTQKNNAGSESLEISPELYRVTDGKKIWSGLFKSDISNTQNLSSDISEKVLQNIDVVISNAEKSKLQSKHTENQLAYESFLKGWKVKPPGHGAEEDFRTAFRMFQQATILDPNFYLAWLGLAETYKDLYWYGYEAHPSTLDSAYQCIMRAKKINPTDSEIVMCLADYYYRAREYDKSLAEYGKIINDRPNDSHLLQRIAELWRRQGLFEEAIEQMEKGLELDPYNINNITELSWTYTFTGNFDRALELQERAKKYSPDAEWNYLISAIIHWCRGQQDDLEVAGGLLEKLPNPTSDYPAWFLVMQYKFENNPDKILRLTDKLSTEAFELQLSYEPISLVKGLAYLLNKNQASAKKYLESAKTDLIQKVDENPTDFRMHMALGLAYAGLGMKDEAIQSGIKGTEILPLEYDHLLGQDILYGLMRIYAILGENDLALDTMAKLLSVPSSYRGFFLTLNPEFENLKQSTRFNDLIEMQNQLTEKFKN